MSWHARTGPRLAHSPHPHARAGTPTTRSPRSRPTRCSTSPASSSTTSSRSRRAATPTSHFRPHSRPHTRRQRAPRVMPTSDPTASPPARRRRLGSRRCTRCSRSRSRRRLCDSRAIPAQFGAQFSDGPSPPAAAAGEDAQRQQARALRVGEARAVQGARRVAGAGRPLRTVRHTPAQPQTAAHAPLLLPLQVDLFALSVRGRPLVDAEELLPSCFRCQVRRRGPSLSHPPH